MDDDWDDGILSELSDSAFDFPPLEFEDDEDEEEGECTSSGSDGETELEVRDEICLDEALFPNLSKKLAASKVKHNVKITPVNKQIEVLVDVDDDHKKIITLNDGKDNLELAFVKAISKDAALYEYVGVKVLFKVYSKKFDSWVDYDKTKELEDGMHLKAVFLKKPEPPSLPPVPEIARRPDENDYINSLNEYVKKRNSNKYKKPYKPYGAKAKQKHWKKKNSQNSSTVINTCAASTIPVCYNSELINNTHHYIQRMQYQEIDNEEENEDEYDGIPAEEVPVDNDVVAIDTKSSEKQNFTQGQAGSSPTLNVLQGMNRDCPAVKQNKTPALVATGRGMHMLKNNIFSGKRKSRMSQFLKGGLYRMSLGLTDKNPISALHELSTRMKWDPPKFELLRHCTVGAVNHFWMQVTVNGEVYSPSIADRKKKDAKTSAAKICLEKLGILKSSS